jgi:hypothetical protein
MYATTKEETNPFLVGIAAHQAAHVYEVWPENHEVFLLFSAMQTQWRTGACGPSGLDYNAIFTYMTMKNLSIDLLDDIRVMESAALTEIHRKKD